MAGQRQSGKASVPSSQFRRPILSVGAMSLLSKPKIAVDRRPLLIGGGVGAGLLLAWSVWPREQSMNLEVREGETAIELGRASCRDRGGQSVYISGVAVALKK